MGLSLAAATLGAAGIGAGASLLGGKQSNDASKKMLRMQMNESIQRRVKDARKAGVHPLFALGASVGASPASGMGDSGITAAGDAVASGLKGYARAKSSERQARINDAVAKAQVGSANASAARDIAEAQLLDSERKRTEIDMYSRGRDAYNPSRMESYMLGPQAGNPELGRHTVVPVEQQAQQKTNPNVQAGIGPAWVERYDIGGYTIKVPQEDLNLDFVANLAGGYQMLENRVKMAINKGRGIVRIQGKDGRFYSFKIVPKRKRQSRRGHGARR